MLSKKRLSQFLVEAKKSTYASGDSDKKVEELDYSTTLIYSDGKRLYHDNYFGGEPYGGREVVFYESKPVYIMTYYGWVKEGFSNVSGVYKFLQKALTQISENYPYRGPKIFTEGKWEYKNTFQGNINRFSGEETIYLDGKVVYVAKYIGGDVDR